MSLPLNQRNPQLNDLLLRGGRSLSPEQPASPAPSAPLVIDGVDFSEFLDNAPASRKTAAAPIPDPQPIREPVKTPEANKPPAPEKSAVTEDVPAPDTAAAQPAARRVGIVSILLRIFAFAAALATAGFLYTQTMQNRQSSASFDAVSSAVLQSIDLTDMQEADAQMVRRLYGFAPSEMDGCLLYYPATNMGARELLLVKSFEGYGVEQYDLLSNSVVEIQGNYILFVVHENAAAAAQAFLKAL